MTPYLSPWLFSNLSPLTTIHPLPFSHILFSLPCYKTPLLPLPSTAPMHLTKVLCLFLIAAVSQISAQSLASTAGVPATQNIGDGGTSTAFAPGLGGSSTGTSLNFQGGATAPPPSSSVIHTMLTGSALSAEEASLSTQRAQESGSNGMYTSTTGGAISGISSGLPGGYNEPTPSTTGGAGTAADSTLPVFHFNGVLTWMMAIMAGLIGALVIL